MFLFLLLLFQACTSSQEVRVEHKILGRSGLELYAISTPLEWNVLETSLTSDTMKPIAEFHGNGFKVVIHNFPGMRIPPEAQVSRWKKLNPEARITETAFNGYRGLVFEDEEVFAIALEVPSSKQGEKYAPVTLKATGQIQAKELMKAFRTFMTLEPFP